MRAYITITTAVFLSACGEAEPSRPSYTPNLYNPRTAFEEVGAQAVDNDRINVSVVGLPGKQDLVILPSSDHWRDTCLRHTVVQPMHEELWPILRDISGNFTLPLEYGWDASTQRDYLKSELGKHLVPSGSGLHKAFMSKEQTKPLSGNVYLSDWSNANGPADRPLPTVVQFYPEYLTTSVTQRECINNAPRLAKELRELNMLLSPLRL